MSLTLSVGSISAAISVLPKSKWIIFFEGGAWSHDRDTCYERSNTELGSSNCFPRYLRLEGLLSNQAHHNPDFYTWTSVFIRQGPRRGRGW